MSYLPNSFMCDVCGVPKREVNHWWNIDMNSSMAWRQENALDGNSCRAFVLVPFDPELARQDSIISVCGHACAHKVMDEYLSHILAEAR